MDTAALIAIDTPPTSRCRDRWLADFEQAGLKDAVKPLILKRNAMRLLKLDA